MIDNVQSVLSRFQAIPIAGPILVSPVKAIVSKAQIVAGLVVGIFSGMGATTAAILGMDRLAGRLADASLLAFSEAGKGVGSLFYACANMATLGILGICVELSRRNTIVIHCEPHHHHHHHRSWFAPPPPVSCF